MSKPLTDSELRQLPAMGVVSSTYKLPERAAAEIHDLRARVKQLLFDNNFLKRLINAQDDRPARIESAISELTGLLKEYGAFDGS